MTPNVFVMNIVFTMHLHFTANVMVCMFLLQESFLIAAVGNCWLTKKPIVN